MKKCANTCQKEAFLTDYTNYIEYLITSKVLDMLKNYSLKKFQKASQTFRLEHVVFLSYRQIRLKKSSIWFRQWSLCSEAIGRISLIKITISTFGLEEGYSVDFFWVSLLAPEFDTPRMSKLAHT